MVSIEKVDTRNKAQVRRFVNFHFDLYKGHPQWVPPLRIDCENQLNREKHPFYEHSDADFFLAIRDGKIVGRIGALENKNYNKYHNTRTGQFYLFDSIDDLEVAAALFDCVFEWARNRRLDSVIGPKGFGPVDGYGILVDGFEHRQMMNMMNYNFPYYSHLIEAQGFVKEVDFVSCYLGASAFAMPERVHRISERIQQRGTLRVKRFRNKAELKAYADKIGKAYNNAFVNNWEYVPLTEKEIKFVLDNILMVAVPKLIKIITHDDEAVGFLFGFPDISAAMQRANGRLLPFGLVDMLLELKRTNWIALNGMGILPEYHGIGGNALMYSEMEKTVRDSGFEHADLTQVAESARQMRQDLENVGGKAYKNHRVYRKML